VTLLRGRIYILPTGLGAAFGLMLFAMLLGSLNYGNNLGLGLTFLLAALGVVAMHACHRNLEALVVRAASTDPPFAGGEAVFRIALANPGRALRRDLEAVAPGRADPPASIAADGETALAMHVPTRRRGSIVLERVEIATHFPYGLFRAWAVLHPDLACLVYPRPAENAPPPPQAPGLTGSGIARRGDDDFAGLKDYHPGDPPRHIAWKAYARAGELLIKEQRRRGGDAALRPRRCAGWRCRGAPLRARALDRRRARAWAGVWTSPARRRDSTAARRCAAPALPRRHCAFWRARPRCRLSAKNRSVASPGPCPGWLQRWHPTCCAFRSGCRRSCLASAPGG
jgi:hypothetical protein